MQRGRQHHAAKGLPRRERQAVRGFDLAARRGLDAGADDLRRIGPQVDHHGQHGSELGRELEPQRRQAKEQEEQLHDEGRVAHQFHIAGHSPAQRCRPVPQVARPCPGTGGAQQQAQHGADDGEGNGPHHAPHQQRPRGQHGRKVELNQHGGSIQQCSFMALCNPWRDPLPCLRPERSQPTRSG